jgi:hypothetical protein
MMGTAQRDDKLVAYFPADRTLLGEPKVMGIRRLATTDQTRTFGHPFDMHLVTQPKRLRNRFASLSSAIRLFVFEHYRALARETQNSRADVKPIKQGRVASSIPSMHRHGHESWTPD